MQDENENHAPVLPANQNVRILIVDDEKTNVRVLEALLKKDGFKEVQGITDPRKAVSVYAEFRPDIILLDLMMPEVDGFDVMAQLKPLIPEHEFLPILILTASHSKVTKHRALTSGASDFLTKPFDLIEVSLRVGNLLRIRQQQQKLRLQQETLLCQQRQLEDQNRNLEEKVAERTHALQISQEEVVQRLAQANEFRDDNTGGHIRRVSYLSGAVARQLGLAANRVALIAQASTLHDVGKIGISDGILLKPARLDEPETTTMRAHTLMGAAILANGQSDVIRLAEIIALSHHERWDGQGYPNRLRGEEIPLEGRIVAVVDVFDALTHERPYKLAWTIDEALEEIQRMSSSHFDPKVVEALTSLPRGSLVCEPLREPAEPTP
jgi:putative two-component system response regulator